MTKRPLKAKLNAKKKSPSKAKKKTSSKTKKKLKKSAASMKSAAFFPSPGPLVPPPDVSWGTGPWKDDPQKQKNAPDDDPFDRKRRK
jgi:hypothetical protein